MALELELRHPVTVKRLGNSIWMRGDRGNRTTIRFGSDTDMKEWLVDVTAQVLGYGRAEMVMGTEVGRDDVGTDTTNKDRE